MCIIFLHDALFVGLSFSNPDLSYLYHKQLPILGLTALFVFSWCIHIYVLLRHLITWSYHLSRVSVIFLDACATLVVHIMFTFRIISLLVTPHIHLRILISFISSRGYWPFVVAQCSAPYNIARLTTLLSTFPICVTDILQSHNTSLHLFHFLFASFSLCLMYVAMPPVDLSYPLETIYLKRCTTCSSSLVS